MSPFFPHHAIEWTLHEPKALRRLSLSLVGMAVLAAVLLRAVRWALLAYGQGRSWGLVLGGVLLGAVLLLGIATAHLGNFPVRQWIWRAPLFAILESASETAISAVLIALGVERLGTQYEHFHDLPSLAIAMLGVRLALVMLFALVLAGVVQLARFLLLKHEHRASTAMAIHEDHVRQVRDADSTG